MIHNHEVESSSLSPATRSVIRLQSCRRMIFCLSRPSNLRTPNARWDTAVSRDEPKRAVRMRSATSNPPADCPLPALRRDIPGTSSHPTESPQCRGVSTTANARHSASTLQNRPHPPQKAATSDLAPILSFVAKTPKQPIDVSDPRSAHGSAAHAQHSESHRRHSPPSSRSRGKSSQATGATFPPRSSGSSSRSASSSSSTSSCAGARRTAGGDSSCATSRSCCSRSPI